LLARLDAGSAFGPGYSSGPELQLPVSFRL
jgi:hypothetical protein